MFYLMHATGAPALVLTFDSIDDAYEACERHFGDDAWNHTVVLAALDETTMADVCADCGTLCVGDRPHDCERDSILTYAPEVTP